MQHTFCPTPIGTVSAIPKWHMASELQLPCLRPCSLTEPTKLLAVVVYQWFIHQRRGSRVQTLLLSCPSLELCHALPRLGAPGPAATPQLAAAAAAADTSKLAAAAGAAAAAALGCTSSATAAAAAAA